jgi:hypothetical protein
VTSWRWRRRRWRRRRSRRRRRRTGHEELRCLCQVLLV